MAAPILLAAFSGFRGMEVLGQTISAAAEAALTSADSNRSESDLPSALPDRPPSLSELLASQPFRAPAPAGSDRAVRLRLDDAVRRSLANVQTVQANIAVRTATVARFEALTNFVPLMSLPQFMSGFSRFTPTSLGSIIDFPDLMGYTQFSGQAPGLDHLSASRLFLQLPLDPSGQILSLPVAEEGIHAKVLMEQLVRRSQATLAIQSYFEAKQIAYGIRVAKLAVNLARESRALTERRLMQRQVYDVEVNSARMAEIWARIALADLEKNARVVQRRLAVVLHQSRLLVPQDGGPLPIDLDCEYAFDLADPDLVDMTIVPDFPSSREEAIQLAKRQRVEVRILVVGLRIAYLRSQGARLRLLGTGSVPAELSFKNTTAINHGVALVQVSQI
jgi:hypothetical protein